jgi:hypothetical protein
MYSEEHRMRLANKFYYLNITDIDQGLSLYVQWVTMMTNIIYIKSDEDFLSFGYTNIQNLKVQFYGDDEAGSTQFMSDLRGKSNLLDVEFPTYPELINGNYISKLELYHLLKESNKCVHNGIYEDDLINSLLQLFGKSITNYTNLGKEVNFIFLSS